MSVERTFFFRVNEPFGELSNWYCSKDQIHLADGIPLNCVEAYMMYKKAVLFRDWQTSEEIIKNSNNPKKCKELGRQVRDFDPDIWDLCKDGIVFQACRKKFELNHKLGQVLKSTYGELIEASPYDRIWGIGFSEKDARRHLERGEAYCKQQWGENRLGKILTVVREDLKRRV